MLAEVFMGFVYIFTNEWIPELVKIGFTETSIQQRLRETKGTWVPGRFVCPYALEVDSPRDVEGYVHTVIKQFLRQVPYGGTEFFKMDLTEAIIVVDGLKKLLDGARRVPDEELDRGFQALLQDDGGSGDSSGDSKPDYQRADKTTFAMLGIPVGSELKLVYKGETYVCVTVDDGNHVRYEGNTYALSTLAVSIKGYSVSGYQCFKYVDAVEGEETLVDRRLRLGRLEISDGVSAG
jgi:hypothetical protein